MLVGRASGRKVAAQIQSTDTTIHHANHLTSSNSRSSPSSYIKFPATTVGAKSASLFFSTSLTTVSSVVLPRSARNVSCAVPQMMHRGLGSGDVMGVSTLLLLGCSRRKVVWHLSSWPGAEGAREGRWLGQALVPRRRGCSFDTQPPSNKIRTSHLPGF